MKNLFHRRDWRLFSTLLTVGLLTATPSLAQPDGSPGMNDNPPNQNPGGGRGGKNRPDRAALQTQMIARSLQSAGFTDEGLIEAVTAYGRNRQAARKPFFDAANALSQALSDKDTTDARIETLWSDFNAALTTEKARTEKAESELDVQIGYSKDPKLAAALTLSGITGDAMGYLNAGQGGRGGPGGMGGGRGGMNGGNGGPRPRPNN